MKVLMVTKFLERRGGVETYVAELSRILGEAGHDVQCFGMDSPERILGNDWGIYAPPMDLAGSQRVGRLRDVARTVKSAENAGLLTGLLKEFAPDVVHFNNIHYHLTPSVVMAAERWRAEAKPSASLVMTMHDYHCIVPCDGCLNNRAYEVCDDCLDGRFARCAARGCVRGGRAKSLVAAMEATYWRKLHVYKNLDAVICPSKRMREKFERVSDFSGRTLHLPNFTSTERAPEIPEKGGYVLYFGAYNRDKGVGTLLDIAERHPEIPFVFCGRGDAAFSGRMAALPNVEDKGFLAGDDLRDVISRATLAAVPSECLENSPFAVLEALSLGTPVLGANAGGIPELVEEYVTGELFEFRNAADLEKRLVSLCKDPRLLSCYAENCLDWSPMTPERYRDRLVRIYDNPAAALADEENA